MIPEEIQKRVADRKFARPRADRAISAGDIRRAVSGGEERIVLVLKVNPRRETAQVALIHPYPEYATESEIVVDQSISDVTFPVVVAAGMRGVVWLKDLGRLICDLPSEVAAACLSPHAVTIAGRGLAVGPRLNGRLDARWDFKTAEIESFSRLCANCTAVSLSASTCELVVDEVFAALLAPSPDAPQMMLAIVELWQARGADLIFTLDHVDLLESLDLLQLEVWGTVLEEDGIAFRLGPLEALIARAISRHGIVEPQPDVRVGVPELIGAR